MSISIYIIKYYYVISIIIILLFKYFIQTTNHEKNCDRLAS